MPRKMVGFDIGQREVKMVLSKDGKIRKAVSVPLPDNLVEEGEIKSMDAMADFLRLSAKEHGIPRTHAAVILPDSLVFTRSVQLPVMTPSQLKFNLPYEFKDYLSMEKEKYFYDYASFGTTQQEGQAEEMDLFACAVLKSTIAQYRAMFKRAGFKLQVAIPEQWAYVSALRQENATEGTVCFADLGHGGIRVHVLRDGKPSTRRLISLGIQDLEKQVADEFHVDVHMARTYKEADYNGSLRLDSSRALYERMGVEILKTVNFYNYNNREVSLQSLCLCGGGASIAPMREAIARVTNLQIQELSQLLPQLQGQEAYLKAFGCSVSR